MTWNFPYRPISALQLRCRDWYGSLGLIPGPIWEISWLCNNLLLSDFCWRLHYVFSLTGSRYVDILFKGVSLQACVCPTCQYANCKRTKWIFIHGLRNVRKCFKTRSINLPVFVVVVFFYAFWYLGIFKLFILYIRSTWVHPGF